MTKDNTMIKTTCVYETNQVKKERIFFETECEAKEVGKKSNRDLSECTAFSAMKSTKAMRTNCDRSYETLALMAHYPTH